MFENNTELHKQAVLYNIFKKIIYSSIRLPIQHKIQYCHFIILI